MKTLFISIIMMIASSNSYSLGTARINNHISVEINYSPEDLASFEFNKYGTIDEIYGTLSTKVVDSQVEFTRAIQENNLSFHSDEYESLKDDLACTILVGQKYRNGKNLTEDLEQVVDNKISTSIRILPGWNSTNSEVDISRARECVQKVVSAHLKKTKSKATVWFKADHVYKAE